MAASNYAETTTEAIQANQRLLFAAQRIITYADWAKFYPTDPVFAELMQDLRKVIQDSALVR